MSLRVYRGENLDSAPVSYKCQIDPNRSRTHHILYIYIRRRYKSLYYWLITVPIYTILYTLYTVRYILYTIVYTNIYYIYSTVFIRYLRTVYTTIRYIIRYIRYGYHTVYRSYRIYTVRYSI